MIDIEKALDKKHELELTITSLIQNFQEATGLHITRIEVPYMELSRVGGVAMPVLFHPVEITAELKI